MEELLTRLLQWVIGTVTGLVESILGISVPQAMVEIVYIVVYFVCSLTFIAVFTFSAVYMEQKISARMQDRVGPNRVGPFGMFQTFADAIKLFFKEDIVPAKADKLLFAVAPMIVMVAAFAAFVALPWASTWIVSDLNIGILYILAVSSLSVIGLLMAGWGSNNKWSALGAFRSAAQTVSYELPVAISLLSVIVFMGTLSLQEITAAQSGWFWNWNIFKYFPFVQIAFIIYFFGTLAECNRTPFDIPEAESELVAGHHTEYTGMRFAFFFLAEYAEMFVVSAVGAVVFLGGWNGPLPNPVIPGVFWFLGKAFMLVFIQMWLRWTLPRLRVDQLMSLSWKFLLPASLICLIGTSAWMLVLGRTGI